MTAQLPLDYPPGRWDWLDAGARRDWLEAYREAELAAELAADQVRDTNEAFCRSRDAATGTAYREADRAYNAARTAFLETSCKVVTGIRAIAGIAREIELRGAMERMI